MSKPKKKKPKKRNYKKEYVARLRKNLLQGRTVQQARGHVKGDRGKIATKTRGTRVIKTRRKRTFKTGAQLSSAVEFVFLGKSESSVLAQIRTYAKRESAKRKRKNDNRMLLYRFIYADLKYSERSTDALATSSYNVFFDYEGFLLEYHSIKSRAIANLVASVLFGYST